MLVDFALEVQNQHGLSPQEAIYQACTLRFRPILMTTMAALLGGVPLMVGTGTGSELRQPLGYTIVGGLMLADPDALHHAGGLSLPRPARRVVFQTQTAACLCRSAQPARRRRRHEIKS